MRVGLGVVDERTIQGKRRRGRGRERGKAPHNDVLRTVEDDDDDDEWLSSSRSVPDWHSQTKFLISSRIITLFPITVCVSCCGMGEDESRCKSFARESA